MGDGSNQATDREPRLRHAELRFKIRPWALQTADAVPAPQRRQAAGRAESREQRPGAGRRLVMSLGMPLGTSLGCAAAE